MRVLYGIQCTGNGHITRSIDIINELKKYVQVEVITSGSHFEVPLPFEVKYKRKGLAYYFGKNGSFDLIRTLKENNIFRLRKEIRDLPVHLYDMVITDFEPISAWAARKNWVYTVAVSNQAALTYPEVKKPKSFNFFSKLIMRFFTPSNKKYGLFYHKVNNDIYSPPVRDKIQQAKISKGNYSVVYLPFYDHTKIVKHLRAFADEEWIIFSKHAESSYISENCEVRTINDDDFVAALAGAKGVMCSAGFGTTSEALFMKKKMLVIPMKNQYEQECNAFTLANMGVPVIKSLKKKHYRVISDWLASETAPNIVMNDDRQQLVRNILTDYANSINNGAIH